MRLRLPSTLRKIADWDMRFQLLAMVAIFLAGLALILFEHCARTSNVGVSSRAIGTPPIEAISNSGLPGGGSAAPAVRQAGLTIRSRVEQLMEALK